MEQANHPEDFLAPELEAASGTWETGRMQPTIPTSAARHETNAQ